MPPPAHHAPVESTGDPPGPTTHPTHPSCLPGTSSPTPPPTPPTWLPSHAGPLPRRPSPADLTGSQTRLPLPHVYSIHPNRPVQTFNQPLVEEPSRADLEKVRVMLAIEGREPGHKGDREVADDRHIATATHFSNSAGKEIVDATVAHVEQYVDRLEGILGHGHGVQLEGPAGNACSLRYPLGCRGERRSAHGPGWCPSEMSAEEEPQAITYTAIAGVTLA